MLALRDSSLRALCEAVVVGEPAVWKRAGWTPALAGIVDTGLRAAAPAYGAPTAETGRLSFSSLERCLSLIGRGQARALVTAPISKTAWDKAGVAFRDHTEWLRATTGAPGQMVLGLPEKGLWAALATRHVPLAEVAERLTIDDVAAAAGALHEAMRLLGKPKARLGLCGFNPHAGEEGLLGPEESRLLAPAAKRCARLGLPLEGPIAADTAWRWHVSGRLDGLVALYHDQALIPLKTAGGLSIVNWTVGIPFVRTSPGHGTGFDIAGRLDPDPAATLQAALLAARLAA